MLLLIIRAGLTEIDGSILHYKVRISIVIKIDRLHLEAITLSHAKAFYNFYKFEDCFQFRVWIEICNLTICQILYCILTLFLLKSNIFFLNPNLQLLYKYPPSFEPFSKSPKEREPIKVFIRFIGLSSSKLDRRS